MSVLLDLEVEGLGRSRATTGRRWVTIPALSAEAAFRGGEREAPNLEGPTHSRLKLCIRADGLATSSKTQLVSATETPFDPTAWKDYPRNLLSLILFQRWPPRDELETQAVVDHRETAGSKRDALAVDARYVLALS